jgi:quercetin 2,3-dioxygenase
MSIRSIVSLLPGMPVSDGAGVNLTRIIGTPKLEQLDPFLLLDEFRSENPDDYMAGFPDHPHRGFETVTYMRQGRMRHKDSAGNSGLLTDGSVQWMTAGRGIIHSEMPEQTAGKLWGYQLWVNLPAKHKMMAPRYQDIPPQKIRVAETVGMKVTVIAGEWRGVKGPVETIWPVEYFDVRLLPGARFEHDVPDGYTVVAYPYYGSATAPGETSLAIRISTGFLAVFSDTGKLRINATERGMDFLLLIGKPIKEPIARMGPFVMNTREELIRAAEDYRAGTLVS